MTNPHPNPRSWKDRARHDLLFLAGWTGAWVATLALASFGPGRVWDSPQATLFFILSNLAVGFGMIWANIRYLNGQDELMRQIQLEAMAMALGVGVVVGLSYSLLATSNIIEGNAEIGGLVFLMGMTYLIATLAGNWRYR